MHRVSLSAGARGVPAGVASPLPLRPAGMRAGRRSWTLSAAPSGPSTSNPTLVETAPLAPAASTSFPSPSRPPSSRSPFSYSSSGSYDALDSLEIEAYRFTAAQLGTFGGLAAAMRNCSTALVSLAVGNVVLHATEAVVHAHHHGGPHGAEQAAGAGAGAAVAEAAGQVAAAAPAAMVFMQDMMRAVSFSDVAFMVNALIPAALISYAVGPFAELAKGPDTPQMALALKGVGRLSLTMQQLAWTSGSVGVVLLLEAAVKYPPMVGVASGACLALAVARGAALTWVVSRHTTSGEEVSRTLAALRGGSGAAQLNPLDAAASWLALGALLQAEPSIHRHGHGHKGHSHGHEGHEGHEGHRSSRPAPTHSAAVGVTPHYSFDTEEERVLRSLVEGCNAAGLAIMLQVLATLSLGIADAATDDSSGLVSNTINAAQKAANALLLFTASGAFDRALHNEDAGDDTDHLLEGLGREHSGMTGLFTSMAVLSWALLTAGGVALLVPALEESPLGVLVGDGVIHASTEMIIEVLEVL